MQPASKQAAKAKGSARIPGREIRLNRIMTRSCPCPSRLLHANMGTAASKSQFRARPFDPFLYRTFLAVHLYYEASDGMRRYFCALHPLAKGRRAGEVRCLGACQPG